MRHLWIVSIACLTGCQGILSKGYERESRVIYLSGENCVLEIREGSLGSESGLQLHDEVPEQADLHGDLESE